MSEVDVREIKLQLRYPESRQEDITDAYMRGYKSVMQVTDKLITRLNEENAELRKQLQDAEHDESMAWDRVRKVESQIAELREPCAGLLTGYECGYGELCKGCTWDGLGDPKTFPCLPRVKARELGIEVD